MSELDERRRRLREDFVEARGFWSPFLGELLALDPEFFEAYADLSGVPWRQGRLEPKVKHFVLLAMDAAATHMYAPGVREHVRDAIALGATAQELMEVLELTSTLGIHACNTGVPILMEELEAVGRLPSRELSERQRQIKAEFERNRGYWNSFWDDVLVLDADFFEAYTQFSSVPWKHGPLEPKVKELIYTAFDVAATHMFAPGLRQHIRNAIGYGATCEEIMEVFELVSTLGVQACALGIPILLEESEAAGAQT
jgi:alkylhydroperoxidase/carboxymuconolactone decarboxylase family protein YurZ